MTERDAAAGPVGVPRVLHHEAPWQPTLTMLTMLTMLTTAGAVLLLAHLLLPGQVGRYVGYCVAAGAAALAVGVGVRLHRPRHPAGWRLVQVGLWFHAGYGVVGLGRALLPAAGWQPAWHLAEVVVDAVGHLVIAAAAVVFLARRRPGADRDGLIDLATVLVAGGLLAWQVVARGLLPGDLGTTAPVAVALLMAAAFVVGVRLFRTHQPPAVLVLLAAAVVAALLGDVAEVVHGAATVPRQVESLWLGAALLVGAAALQPGMRQLSEPEPAGDRPVSTARLVGLGAALLVNPLLVVLPNPPPGRSAAGLGAGVAVLTVLVLWRIGRLVTDREQTRRDLVEQIAQRDALAVALHHAASHDGLTGLPNREAFLQQLTAALTATGKGTALPSAAGLAVLFLDLDGFKPVNDGLGHAAGDELLVGVAGRLRACLRGGDVAARLGGDEFVVLVHLEAAGAASEQRADPGLLPAMDPSVVADRVVAALAAPFALAAGTVTIGASVGVARSHGGAVTAEQLLRQADVAMYQAKRAGKGRRHIASVPA